MLKPGGTFCGCFYVRGEHKRTDWFVRHVYEKAGFFTPPYETASSLKARLDGMCADVDAYFAVSDAKSELSPWNSLLQVTSRSYMLGYNDLRDPSVSVFFRFLARVGDGMMKMQIVKIGFGGKQ